VTGRAKRRGLLRNMAVALGNSGDASKRPILERLALDADPVVSEHARWALGRLPYNASIRSQR
jgi:epoxyqueuosine reductase